MNLIQLQREYIDRLLAATPYSERNPMYGQTFLNRKARVIRGAGKRLRNALEQLGFTADQTEVAIKDAQDMAELEYYAE